LDWLCSYLVLRAVCVYIVPLWRLITCCLFYSTPLFVCSTPLQGCGIILMVILTRQRTHCPSSALLSRPLHLFSSVIVAPSRLPPRQRIYKPLSLSPSFLPFSFPFTHHTGRQAYLQRAHFYRSWGWFVFSLKRRKIYWISYEYGFGELGVAGKKNL